jgi:hypothetical protein
MTTELSPDRTGPPHALELEATLAAITAGAAARDADPARAFPAQPFTLLRGAGALAFNAAAGPLRPPARDELSLVRRVAAADASVGRILDGHLNAVERLAVHAPAALRDTELAAVRAGRLLAGVWGGNPIGDEGPPASIAAAGDGEVLWGVKTFCSGAGGLERAAVLARQRGADDSPPVLVWVDLTDPRHVEIDRSWYRAAGLTCSESHRVVFHDAPVLARLGPPGAISHQPWFGRDALRTAASWAGIADAAVRAGLAELGGTDPTELEALAAGRMLTARETIEVWLTAAATAMDGPADGLADVALHGRAAIAQACRTILDEAARACGSRPFARGGELDRAHRDLALFLLQHRLDPMLARAGRTALTAGEPR